MIKFFNIRSKEVRIAETEPHIAALWSSSDHSPNITQGQDFGWRLAPEVVVEMKKIKQNFPALLDIAKRINKNVDEVTEPDILMHISQTNAMAQNAIAHDVDYTDEYNEQIRQLEQQQNVTDETVTTTTTTKSIAELEAELAARRAAEGQTTTTTTKVPTTTTTTTKSR